MQNSSRDTVLVVDDNSINLKVLANCLSKAGFKVLAAEDGPAALDLALKGKPDIILLDVMMPGMDGFETCTHLKENPVTRDIPVLFLSARSEIDDKVKGFNSGAADYITKPYRDAEVLARVNTHLTIARQKRELEAALLEREHFMRIAAHDLRNPLSVVMFLANAGSTDHEIPEDLRESFVGIEKGATQMKAIIDDFLALQLVQVRQDAGMPFDLARLIALVVEQQGLVARGKGTVIENQASNQPKLARGDGDRVHQILSNYLSNAIKYSPPKSLVKVTLHSEEKKWRVEVSDQGPGVSEKERDKLFVEFGRISNKPTGGEQSTGLGLAIVKKLAASMGGRVGADFPASGGSVFWLELNSAKI